MCLVRRHIVLMLMVMLGAMSAVVHAGQGQQVKRPKGTGGFNIGYLEYLPQDYDDRAPATYPVLIFFQRWTRWPSRDASRRGFKASLR